MVIRAGMPAGISIQQLTAIAIHTGIAISIHIGMHTGIHIEIHGDSDMVTY